MRKSSLFDSSKTDSSRRYHLLPQCFTFAAQVVVSLLSGRSAQCPLDTAEGLKHRCAPEMMLQES